MRVKQVTFRPENPFSNLVVQRFLVLTESVNEAKRKARDLIIEKGFDINSYILCSCITMDIYET